MTKVSIDLTPDELESLLTALLRAEASELSEVRRMQTQATVYWDRPRTENIGVEISRGEQRRALLRRLIEEFPQ